MPEVILVEIDRKPRETQRDKDILVLEVAALVAYVLWLVAE